MFLFHIQHATQTLDFGGEDLIEILGSIQLTKQGYFEFRRTFKVGPSHERQKVITILLCDFSKNS